MMPGALLLLGAIVLAVGAVVLVIHWVTGPTAGLCPWCREAYLHQSRDAWYCRQCGRIL